MTAKTQPQSTPVFLQLNIYFALAINQISLAFFTIASKPAFVFLSPVVFAALRLLVCTVTVFPVMSIVDRDFKFPYRTMESTNWKQKIMQKLPNFKDTLWFIAAGVALTINQTVCTIF